MTSQKQKKFHEKELLTNHTHKIAVLWLIVGIATALVFIGWLPNIKANVQVYQQRDEQGVKITEMLKDISNQFSKGFEQLNSVLNQEDNANEENTNSISTENNSESEEAKEEIKKLEEALFPELINLE